MRPNVQRKLLHWLVRLYPRTWLKRYEAEFRSVLDDAEPRWKDVFDVFKEGISMRVMGGVTAKALVFGIAAASITGLVLWLRPVQYESQAMISTRSMGFREHPIPEEMNTLARRAFSREKLVKVVEAFNLYPEVRAKGQTEEAIEQIRRNITIKPISFPQPSSALVSISFRYSDPALATRVTKDLVTRMIDENMRHATESMADGRLPTTIELLSPASEGRRPAGTKPVIWIALALAEGLQLGLIGALLRRRSLPAAQES